MGLDVYLRWYKDYDATQAKEQEASKKHDEIWAEYPKYDECTEQQKEEAREKVHQWNHEHGLSNWGSVEDESEVRRIEEPSKTDPEHMFKIGYFRSSYNDGGLNAVMREQLAGRDLYWIFQPPEDREYCFVPQWDIARGRVTQLVNEWKARLDDGCFSVVESSYSEFLGPFENCTIKTPEDAQKAFDEEYERFRKQHPEVEYGPFEVLPVSFNTLNFESQINEKCDALEAYLHCRDVGEAQNGDLLFDNPIVVRGIVSGVREATVVEQLMVANAYVPCTYYIVSKGQKGEWTSQGSFDSGCYSNRNGAFYFGGKGFEVVGIINGLRKRWFVKDEKIPATFAVTKVEGGYEWYFKALQIVAETCEWVMDRPDPENYVLAWSA